MGSKIYVTIFTAFAIIFSTSNNVSAQKPVDSQAVKTPFISPKTTIYPNGVYKMEPQAFGITEAVRNLPTSVEDAKAKSEAYMTKQKLEEIRKQQLREKGVPEEEIQKEEINRINAKVIKKIKPGAGAGEGNFVDPLVNRRPDGFSPENMLMPTPILTFNGASQTDNAALGVGAVLPPDVNGDVGPNHYVSSVNLVYKIFNKNGTVAAGPFKTNSLFNGLPASDPCRTLNSGDPVVVYDQLADRWHISQFAITGTTNCQCVAVSQTSDPTGAYYVWRYDYPSNIFNDYPKVGVWPDAYHMTFNQFNNAGTAFLGAGILSQDRPKALIGDPATSVVYTNIATIDPGAGGLLPPDVDGYMPPPVGMAAVMAEYRANEFGDPLDAIRYYKWVPNFVTPGSSTISVLPDVALAAFDARNPSGRGDIEQLGGANLDGISDRLMHLFKYRNLGTQAAPINSFLGNFSVNVSGVNPTSAATYQTGIRWFEMRRTADVFSVFDQGTHNLTPGNGASGLNNWMGSIAQDNKGNLALGFSQSSTTQRADIKIAGRTGGMVPAGTLNDGEALFFAAAGSQTSSSNRWGDYSAMNVDPVDGCTFWYTQEYYASTSLAGWSTRVGSFIYPSCTPEEKATITGTITICSSGFPVNGASVDATGGYNRVTGVPGTYTMTVAPGTYTVSASKAGGFNTASSAPITITNGQTITVDLCLTGVPLLSSSGITLVSESCTPANGIIDPGETVTVSFPVLNTGAANTVNDVGTLQATGGVTSPSGPQNYGVVVAGGPAVSRNFTFTADPAMQCGANITATIAHMDGATNLGNIIYTIPTGVVGAATTTSYTGPPVSIPDNNSVGVNIILPVSGVSGTIRDLNFRLDALGGCDAVALNANASVDHTFNGDLSFKLTSPGGTTVNLITRRGGGGNNFCTVLLDDDGAFPAASTMPTTGAVAGNFAPESPLSAFDGQNANGNWTLNVSDNASVDVGSLRRFSLIITGSTCCVPSAPCNISSAPFSNVGTCNDNATPANSADDFFTADVTVTFVNAPATGTLQFEPGNDAIAGGGALSVSVVGLTSPYTFTGVRFKADGTPTVAEIEFSAQPTTCVITVVGPTVNSCSGSCTITCPANITVSNAANQCGAVVTYPAPTTTGSCGTITATPASGSFFPVGTTTVTVTSTAGPSCTFTITVVDNQPPTITCPANIIVSNAPNQCGAVVTYSAPTVSDNCPGVTVVSSPASGSFFPVGTTTVTATATDAAGNTATCTFTVRVNDTQPPTITCPANITVSCASAVPAPNAAALTATDNCPGVVKSFVSDVISNQTCANRYTITRTYQATDASGNTATCSHTITVNDQTAPVVTCPANITATTPIGFCTVAVSFTPTATDNCGGAVTITSVPASGSQFSIGTTLVTVTATDACGNSSTCTFNVTVSDGQLPVISQHPVNRTVCAGTNATFSVTSTNAASYQWQQYIGGVWTDIGGQIGSSMTLNAVTHSMNTNTYRVRVIGLCTTVTSGAASLYVNPLPTINLAASIPPILLPGQTLTITATVSPSGGSFVWFKNNAVISGATGSSLTGLTVTNIGTYRAEYTDLNGCRSSSADLFVTAQPSGNLYVYPNPSSGVFQVRFFNQTNEPGTVSVFDEKGARVYKRTFNTTLPYTSLNVDISRLAAGKYLVEVVNSAGRRIGAKWIIVLH